MIGNINQPSDLAVDSLHVGIGGDAFAAGGTSLSSSSTAAHRPQLQKFDMRPTLLPRFLPEGSNSLVVTSRSDVRDVDGLSACALPVSSFLQAGEAERFRRSMKSDSSLAAAQPRRFSLSSTPVTPGLLDNRDAGRVPGPGIRHKRFGPRLRTLTAPGGGVSSPGRQSQLRRELRQNSNQDPLDLNSVMNVNFLSYS